MKVDYQRLYRTADVQSRTFLEASPFPHVVIDDFFASDVFEMICSSFPSPDDEVWKEPSNTHTQGKRVLKRSGGLKESILDEREEFSLS